MALPTLSRLLLLLSAAVAVVAAEGTSSHDDDPDHHDDNEEIFPTDYDAYLEQHHAGGQRSWSALTSYWRRKFTYDQNLERIRKHNQDSQATWQMGVNALTDRQPRELSQFLGYDKSQKQRKNKPLLQLHEVEAALGVSLRDNPDTDLPQHVDWREAGVTTPVKNQGGCGSCWAFASTAVLESHLCLQTKTHPLQALSVQELVSCVPNPRDCGGSGGCAGATAELAFDFVQKHGLVSEWQFGYQSFHSAQVPCSLKKRPKKHHHQEETHPKEQAEEAAPMQQQRHLRTMPTTTTVQRHNTTDYYQGAVMGVGGWVSLPSNDYVAVMNAVAKLGPLAVSVACHPWMGYKSGVFPDATNYSIPQNADVNHLVVLEGYGTDSHTGLDYWLVRNSWGPGWGEGGYIRLERNQRDRRCGIDVTPADGVECKEDDQGQPVPLPNDLICGNSGILYDVTVPIQGFAL